MKTPGDGVLTGTTVAAVGTDLLIWTVGGGVPRDRVDVKIDGRRVRA
jgi:hypothetical protein